MVDSSKQNGPAAPEIDSHDIHLKLSSLEGKIETGFENVVGELREVRTSLVQALTGKEQVPAEMVEKITKNYERIIIILLVVFGLVLGIKLAAPHLLGG